MQFIGSFVDPTEGEEPSEWAEFEVPYSSRIPVALLICAMSMIWVVKLAASGGMKAWGVSAAVLAEGRFETFILHMFAHGPFFHLLMNMVALYSLGGILIVKLGGSLSGVLRFALIFFLSGLAGAVLFLAVHPFGAVPMLGASGAICGLLGLLLRLKPDDNDLHPLLTTRMRTHLIAFLKENALLFALLTVPSLLLGREGGVAWEAHLGGLLFGLFVAPHFMPRRSDDAVEQVV